MAAGKRLAFTPPATVFVRLAALLTSMVQEGLDVLSILTVAEHALLIGVLALEWARRPEGTPDGIRKLIRTALDPDVAKPVVDLDPSAPRREKPHEIGWRTWREEYLTAYSRTYVDGERCGAAMMRAGKRAADLCARTDHHEDADMESLFTWWWRRFLKDPGYSKGAGDPGYLISTSHCVADFARHVQNYGTPWDREVKRIMRPALAPAPTTPRQLASRQPSLFDKSEGARAVAAAAGGKRL